MTKFTFQVNPGKEELAKLALTRTAAQMGIGVIIEAKGGLVTCIAEAPPELLREFVEGVRAWVNGTRPATIH